MKQFDFLKTLLGFNILKSSISYFGGDDEEPVVPQVPSAQQLFDRAYGWAGQRFPQALGAREAGLAGLPGLEAGPEFFQRYGAGMPEITPGFYEQFGPTSLEEATANQYFQNQLEQIRRQTGQFAGQAGIASLGPQLFAQQATQVAPQIGEYLAGLGQQRATQELNRQQMMAQFGQQQAMAGLQGRQMGVQQQLAIDPMQQLLSPFAAVGQEQGNIQAQLQAQAEEARRQQKAAGIGGMGMLGGAALGAIAAPFTGGLSLMPAMAMGAGLGGMVSPMFGGAAGGAPQMLGAGLGMQQSMQQGDLLSQLLSQPQQQMQPPVMSAFPSRVGGGGQFPTFY